MTFIDHFLRVVAEKGKYSDEQMVTFLWLVLHHDPTHVPEAKRAVRRFRKPTAEAIIFLAESIMVAKIE